MSGINLSDQLEGNIRLLLHRDSDVRERVQANLKCLLSQEPNSHCRLPRFHQIVRTDLAKFFLNLKVQVRKKSSYLPEIVTCLPWFWAQIKFLL